MEGERRGRAPPPHPFLIVGSAVRACTCCAVLPVRIVKALFETACGDASIQPCCAQAFVYKLLMLMGAFLDFCLFACLLICLFACLHVHLPACLPACMKSQKHQTCFPSRGRHVGNEGEKIGGTAYGCMPVVLHGDRLIRSFVRMRG